MRTPLFFLLLATVLSTSVRAQNIITDAGEKSVTSLALIKPPDSPFPADSITLRTSLDTFPYGFAFRQDTIILDVNILPPVDEITVELLAGTQSFGRFNFWVDAPSANVHLSIKGKQTIVDSVTLSGVDAWYRQQLVDLSSSKGLLSLSRKLLDLTYLTSGDLMGATFAGALLNLPFVSPGQRYELKEQVLPSFPFIIQRHPRYQELMERLQLIGRKPGNFKRLGFYNAEGKPVRIKLPERSDFYVLNLYSANDVTAQQAHQEIAATPLLDSLFTQVAPMVSISNDPSPALWRLYVNDNDFGWRHFVEDPNQVESLSSGMPLTRRPVYLLMTSKHRVSGVYFTLTSLANAVRWQTRE